jgi:fructose-1,6-bisphosphatase I
MDDVLVTIERFVLDHQPQEARGELTAILYDMALAAKMIASQTRRAGLIDILGYTDDINVQGEQQKKLDVYADEVIYKLNDHTGRLCAMASEEREDFIPIPEVFEKGSYVLVYDPLDGSTNVDTNVSIGTIFGIFRALDWGHRGRLEDCLRPGRDLVAAGYIYYGTSTMFIYSAGNGVHGFTLDPEIGEFLLTMQNIRFPEKPAYYSLNYAYYPRWSSRMQAFVDWLETDQKLSLSHRYVGSLVADFHRNLVFGGLFGYPAMEGSPEGKIRLLYEAAPLAYLAEQAGGYGSDGERSLLEIVPESLHQRTPIFVGNSSLVEEAERQVNG